MIMTLSLTPLASAQKALVTADNRCPACNSSSSQYSDYIDWMWQLLIIIGQATDNNPDKITWVDQKRKKNQTNARIEQFADPLPKNRQADGIKMDITRAN